MQNTNWDAAVLVDLHALIASSYLALSGNLLSNIHKLILSDSSYSQIVGNT